METAKKHNRCFEDGKNTSGEEVKALGEEISSLMAKIKMLETENESKGKELKGAQAETQAVRKSADQFLMEYDRLREDNQNLMNQLESIGQSPEITRISRILYSKFSVLSVQEDEEEEEGEIMEERLQDTDADTLAKSLNKAAEKEEAMEVNTTIQ